MSAELCGWVEDRVGIAEAAKQWGTLSDNAIGLIGGEERDVLLWKALLRCKPSWRRGAQGIGDCVSWGLELCQTMLMAIESELGQMSWIEEAATEPSYGGSRVEARGVPSGGYQDGSTGFHAAKWTEKWGVLLRLDYSGETGNPEHDLTKYSKDKAKAWGNFGCGGANDKGKLDALAKKYPIRRVVQVQKVEEAVAALTNAYPVSIASMAGFGSMQRDANGLCYWTGSWAHQMMLGGIRWRGGKPEFRVFQSWGKSCSGPDPGIDEQVISDCSWWINESTLSRILSSGDCWTYSGISGFEPRKIDTLSAVKRWTDDLV